MITGQSFVLIQYGFFCPVKKERELSPGESNVILMWFILSIIALLCWSGSDLFSKIGCRDPKAKYSPLKMIMTVGVVMGLHAAYEMIFNGVQLQWDIIIAYLPIAAMYILSMALGYWGLKYIELSVSSPICNSSGAMVAIVCFIVYGVSDVNPIMIGAVIAVCIGVVGLGIVEYREDPQARIERQKKSNYKYTKSFAALALPLAYCVIDAAGTFGDTFVLDYITSKRVLAAGAKEPSLLANQISDAVTSSANVTYELMFLLCGIVCAVYVLAVKKEKLTVKQEGPKYLGAIFETVGQFAYIFAISQTDKVMYAAPIISAYCVLSVVWSRIFLKEKLSVKHYIMISITVIGIIVLGIFDA